MQTYQQYIDDILGAVYSPETADPDFLRDSAAMYAEACAEVNDRLRSAGRLLHRGLRSEAIQLAEEEPNLLDMVTMLDFQELPSWREMLVNWGMAEPPQLLIDIAADLNKAYADQQPLESLLKQHRTLALARAPLFNRIQTMRLIYAADKGNETWGADLTIFEKARLKQISGEADAASRGHDLDALARLSDEVRANGWLVERPKSLIDNIDNLRSRVAATAALKTLEQLDEELNAAHMAFDVGAARAVRSRWQEAAATAKLPPDDSLAQRAAPALEWLAEQDRRDALRQGHIAAIAALQRAIDDDLPAGEIQRLYQAASLSDEPLPESLRRRAEQKLADFELHVTRKRRLLIGSLTCVLILMGTGVGFWIQRQAFAKSVADAATSLSQLVDQSQHEKAHDFYASLMETSPAVANSEEVQKHKSQLDLATAAEVSRVAQFAEALRHAQEARRDKPDRGALADAKKLARTASEVASVAELEQSIAATARQRRQEYDQALGEQLVHLQDKLATIEGRREVEDPEQLNSLAQLRDEIRSASQRYSSAASPAMSAQLEPLLVRIDTLTGAIQTRLRQSEARDRITAAVGDVDQYLAEIDAFAASYPDTALAANANIVRSEAKLWQGLLAWSDFLSSSFGADWPKIVDAQTAVQRGELLEAAHGENPLAAYYRTRKVHLESMAARDPESGDSPLNELKQLLRDPLILRLWMIADKLGPRYYARKEPVEADVNVSFDYIAGFDLSEKRGTVLKGNIAFRGVAPQSTFATRSLTLIDEIPRRGWEATFTSIVKAAADPQQDIDPILRLILIQRVLDTAVSGSAIMKDSFAEYRDALSKANVDLSVPWMAPRDDIAGKERKRAEILMPTLPSPQAAIDDAARRFKDIRQPFDDSITWIGWCSRDMSGKFAVLPEQEVGMTGELVVVLNDSVDSAVRLETIGVVDGGAAQIKRSGSNLVIEGRPVFLRTQAKP
jgi:hypothetical protein